MAPKRYHHFTYTAPIRGGMAIDALKAEGEGPYRLVIIPGTPCRKYTLRPMLSTAPKDLEVIGINRPGYGKGHEPVYSFDDQVEALRPLIEKDDDKKTIVMGVSYGGELALKAALFYPNSVAGVITCAALVTEPRAFVLGALPLGDLPGISLILPKSLHLARKEVAQRRSQLPEVFDRCEELQVPVTVIHGNIDHLVSRSNAKHLMAKFKPSQNVLYRHIPGGTHFMEMQMPGKIYREVRGLIERIEGAA